MLFLKILWAFLAVGALGTLLGLGLSVASGFFAVKKDKRVEQVLEALPGLNCGACGFAGCESYAEALVEKDEDLTLCKPGGQEAAEGIARILGKQAVEQQARRVAQVHCRGGIGTAEYKYAYVGDRDCNAAVALYGGPKACPFGCLGFGSCIKVCPVDAIAYDEAGLVWVDKELCIACGKCVAVCPTGVMKMVPYDADKIVACNSTDRGSDVRKYCKVGCIGCKRCERSSPDGGFVVENNVARIDYAKQGERDSAEKACPTHCIITVGESAPPAQRAQDAVTLAAPGPVHAPGNEES